jgi:hypothetical protein
MRVPRHKLIAAPLVVTWVFANFLIAVWRVKVLF